MKSQHAFFISSVFAVSVSLLMLWPYMDAILWGAFTAYFLIYLEDHIDSYIDNRTVTTGIVILLLAGFVGGIFYAILTSVPSIISRVGEFSSVVSGSISVFLDVLNLPESLSVSVNSLVNEIASAGRERIISWLSGIPTLIINLAIYSTVAVFLVKDGKRFKDQTLEVVKRFPEQYREITESLIESVDELFRGVFLTYFIVAIVIGFLAGLGFYALGIDFYWGWGLIIGVFAFFPIVSAPMVYVPLGILYMAALGRFWIGLLILIYGVLVLNVFPEVLLRPYVASQRTKEHPLLLFVGFIIGPLVMGLKGIILGPIILVVTKDILSMKYFGQDM